MNVSLIGGELKFSVDSDTFSVESKTYKVCTYLPENFRSYFADLAERAKIEADPSVWDLSPSVLSLDGSYILFGCTSHDEEPKFKEFFRFDLTSYTLKSPAGIPIKPRRLSGERRAAVGLFAGTPSWVLEFYKFWSSLVYSNTSRSNTKTKLFWLFEEVVRHKDKLGLAEKLCKSGFPASSSDLNILTSDMSKLKLLESSPWEVFGITKIMYQDFCEDPDLLRSTRTSLNKLSEFKFWDQVWSHVKDLGIERSFLSFVTGYSYRSVEFERLISDRSYEPRRLLEYLFIDLPDKQNFSDIGSAIEMLDAYASMSAAIYEKIPEKYPKHLKTDHDIVTAKYNEVVTNLEKAECMNAYENKQEIWSYTSSKKFEDCPHKRYAVRLPSCARDIVTEGKVMHHCVASYIDKMIRTEGKCAILFVRTIDSRYGTWNHRHCIPTLTMEVFDGSIVQIRGVCNRSPIQQEFEFLQEYCMASGLQLASNLMHAYKDSTGKSFKNPEIGTNKEREKEVCPA